LIAHTRWTVVLEMEGLDAVGRLLGTSTKPCDVSCTPENGAEGRHEKLKRTLQSIAKRDPGAGHRRIRVAPAEGYGKRMNPKVLKEQLSVCSLQSQTTTGTAIIPESDIRRGRLS
jgi:hypothetical protein